MRTTSLGLLGALLIALLASLQAAAPAPRVAPKPSASQAAAARPSGPRSIILLVGDGMAAPQLYAARVLKGLDTGVPVGRLHIDSLPVLATFDNHAAGALVGDSASQATAIATGVRVGNRILSWDAGGPLPTIMEHARSQGRSGGLVASVSVANAVPAAFAAHGGEQTTELDIAAQYADKPVADVILGGGRDFFLPIGTDGGRRTDARNLVEELRSKGYACFTDRKQLVEDEASPRLLGLFGGNALAYEIDRDHGLQPSLADMTEAALRSLSRNPRGFFLVVDGGKIDWACHSNDLATAVRETIAFDDAVAVALEYQRGRRDTLLIVLGDHETGGLTFPPRFDPQPLKMQQASVEHVLESIPPRSLDPNSSEFLKMLRERLSLDADVPLREKLKLAQKSPRDMLYVLTAALNARTHAAFSSSGHTALPPLLAAGGPGQALFAGSYDITDIYARMARLLGKARR